MPAGSIEDLLQGWLAGLLDQPREQILLQSLFQATIWTSPVSGTVPARPLPVPACPAGVGRAAPSRGPVPRWAARPRSASARAAARLPTASGTAAVAVSAWPSTSR